MTFTFKNILRALSIPISLVAVYISMVVLWHVFHLPSPEKSTQLIESYFLVYGLWIVLIASFIEGVLLIGQYFPGGLVIFLGVISARGDIVRVVEVVSVVSLSFFVAYYVNYILGKYGWYKLFAKFGLADSIHNAKEKLSRHALFAVLSNYWDPNVSSIIATAAGVLDIPLPRFLLYSACGIAVWNTFWGILVYYIGEAILNNEDTVFFSIILVWSAVIVTRVFFWDRIHSTFLIAKRHNLI